MSGPDRRQLLTALRAVNSARGWQDPSGAIRALVDDVYAQSTTLGVRPSEYELRALIPQGFLAANTIDAENVAKAFAPLILAAPREQDAALITIDDIDSFRLIRGVSPKDVGTFADPLDLPERAVKALLAAIIGEPYTPKDWGGEGNDLFTDRLNLDGAPVAAAFLLKGSGTRGKLTIARLGKNGDQIVRMANSPAELLVVQHVGPIEEAVRSTLTDTVLARRSARRPTIGSVWDGVASARLFVAYGMLDAASGEASAAGKEVLRLDSLRLSRT